MALYSFPGSNEAERTSRLAFLEMGDEDRHLLRELYENISPRINLIIDEWYEFLLARPETSALLTPKVVQERLKGMQARYFRTLLTGPYDEAYFRERVHIGLVHARVGLPPPSYMGAYRKHQDLVHRHLLAAGHREQKVSDWMRAYTKVIYLDMALALDSYFATLNREVVQANVALEGAARDLERRNEELSRQYRRAQEAAELKRELLGRISHEFHTPLNAILGYSDLLLDGIDGALAEAQAGSVRRVREHGLRLLAMIDRLIETAKAASAGPDPVPFDPIPVLERLLPKVRETAQAKGLAFSTPVDGLPWLVGEPEGFGLALHQLLENAITFTPSGRVTLEARRLEGSVSFVVTDTGIGIPPDQREKVFEPFHQVDGGDTRTVGGLGMGLALARQTVESMGGRLRLQGSGPEGSVFVLELPLAEASRRGAEQGVGEPRSQGRPKAAWPKRLGQQAGLVRAALQASSAPLTARELARSFQGARASRIRPLLEALSELGHAKHIGEGRYIGL